MKLPLSKLEKVPLRDVWPNEASDFTKWLAEEENLALLSDEIGIRIELLEREADVGKFSMDILAQDSDSDRRIVIENQYGKTDHSHLGKIITYAGGYEAEILIWIVEEARGEHKQAVEWLNMHAEELNIFIVEIKVVRIDDSAPAPQFSVVIQPNDWPESKEAGAANKPTTTRVLQLAFWEGFNEFVERRQGEIKPSKPAARQWYNISFGIGSAYIALTVNSQSKRIGCEIYTSNAELYDALLQQKEEIESELQELQGDLRWDGPTSQKKKGKILLTDDVGKDGDFLLSDSTWEKHHGWMLAAAEKFQQVFTPRINKFKRGDAD